MTIAAIGKLFPMFPMTVEGMIAAVAALMGRGERRPKPLPRPLWPDGRSPLARSNA
jgi:hypothetical protein